MTRARPGRRPGAPDTKGDILTAARTEFAAKGYDGASMRGIAARAGVDASLVHHYFRGKEKLFLAAMEIPFDPEVIAERVEGGPLATVGERAARTFFEIWGDPDRQGPLLAVLRSAMSHPDAARMLREFVTRSILSRVLLAFEGVPDAPLRAEAMVSHLIGVAIARYVVQLEPIASASDDEIVALIGPALQTYVDKALATKGLAAED
ncbi:TetR family transcriptional regulator [Haloactinopolyspora sp.]|uniref:TetR/AcrR family transcriptional regulator n=1 Tax=Haloactinopolyspora sp. TaxID=1966353 RepID=UPI00261AE3C4|nr:TetR family transcriptional regulator [Haloactinopolyspora sp.]